MQTPSLEKELEKIVAYALGLGIDIGYFSGTIKHSDGSFTSWHHDAKQGKK